METKIAAYILLLAATTFLWGCPSKRSNSAVSVQTVKQNDAITTPIFNPDSAYEFVAKQVAFGPRVPNTVPHAECALFLAEKLTEFGALVTVQEAKLKAYDNTIYDAKNIIGSFNPDHPDRIILCAHWDTRHVADHDPDKSRRLEPIDGANDGGSGVGVLLEIARQIGLNPLNYGVDIIFFDAEDQGTPEFLNSHANTANTWCLGSQYWSKNPHKKGYSARYGILLDMVGAEDAVFPMEGYSMQFAPDLVNKVWSLASKMGYSNYFVFERSAPVTDDHFFINTLAGIPCIDIIHYRPGMYGGFGKFWHTHNDNMSSIHKPTLHAVGRVVLEHIYQQPF
jgi:Zn-dependent M28 family amino/carboxypeptidase